MGKIVSYHAVTNVLTRHVIDLTGVVSLNAEMEINAIKVHVSIMLAYFCHSNKIHLTINNLKSNLIKSKYEKLSTTM